MVEPNEYTMQAVKLLVKRYGVQTQDVNFQDISERTNWVRSLDNSLTGEERIGPFSEDLGYMMEVILDKSVPTNTDDMFFNNMSRLRDDDPDAFYSKLAELAEYYEEKRK